MKKALYVAFFSLMLAMPAIRPAHATVFGIAPGDLIKLKDDHDPKTLEDRVVYYYDTDWYRHPFPNQKVFESWYRDFSGVKELTKEEMAQLPLGKPINYRPGTRLVKIPSIPKVYAVEPGGVLRWIESETVAKALFGDAWNRRVDDVSDAMFTNYREGAPLTTALWPTGSIVRLPGDTALYFIEGLTRRYIPPTVRTEMRIDDADVIDVKDLSAYDDAGLILSGDLKYVDTSEKHYVDTLPRPAFDFPANIAPLEAGTEQPLAAFRLTSGMPVIVRQLTVTIEGPLWSGSTPNLTDLRFVDVKGGELFGTKQLEQQGSGKETVTFTGAYTLPTDTIGIVEFRATTSSALAHGATFKVTVDRGGVRLADGGNGEPFSQFSPKTEFPTTVVSVK